MFWPAFFQEGLPIYSAKFVRFRMGHSKSTVNDSINESGQSSFDEKLVWTYTSPEFPMTHVSSTAFLIGIFVFIIFYRDLTGVIGDRFNQFNSCGQQFWTEK